MTAPVPVPPPLNAPLMTLDELVSWLPGESEIPEERVAFAWKVIEGASVVIRDAGSTWWTASDTDPLPEGWIPIPYRAKLMLELKVKNFYEHPDGAVSETIGPISSRYLDDIVQQIELSDAEKMLLQQLAVTGGPVAEQRAVSGLWALSTTRGPMETHPRWGRGIVHAPYWREYGQAVPYFVEDAFGSPAADSPGVIGYIP